MNKFAISLLLALSASITCYGSTAAEPMSSATKGRDYYEERGEIVWEVPTQKQVIALTFDDGPDPKNTGLILDLLKQYEAKATFFVVGSRVEKHPELVARAIGEGHEIGNHSFTHPSFHHIAAAKLKNELSRTQDAIYNASGFTSVLFRPPGGSYNEGIVHTSQDIGMLTVLWSWHQDTLDWRKPGAQAIVRKVLNNARNGDIVLMHDYVPNSSQTVEALKTILPELKQRGFSFVTVTELLSYQDKSHKSMVDH
ncbi:MULTISPECIES: polysaccharide deacetylase family protein [Paenibacillus]|uniref:Polysaccharide deacetylase n=1 Tax=Paenibacillus campinasensis TaxID=66347 RepID=A0A268F3Z5_9BACL|nr:polysaccharide deacetylase family protein [Paenibacillus campinasensis]MUG64700.1 polysaccharide deacetylase family protein [Paenibacillus campinasensis]PAD80096.1 polysaccharide deacetylase [Paenibacillus campinasensis]